MGRKKINRDNKIMQTFESTKPLKARLIEIAKSRGITVSALIRETLEKLIEERTI